MPTDKSSYKVLIVDDEVVNIKVLNDLLKDDMQVLFATNGKDALSIAKSKRPDLILLDVMLPSMDGHEICKKLKDDPITNLIPIIFVTAKIEEEDEAKGLELGAIDYISKPYRPSIIKVRVKNHLIMKRQRDALERLSGKLANEVDQLVLAEKEIMHLATHDNLTGLPNRMLFMDRLELAVATAKRNENVISVLFVDLDGFKEVNDTLGHDFGDYVLKEAAEKLLNCVRKTDTVARLGGDEFVILLVDVKGRDEIESIAAKMISSLSKSFEFKAETAQISASIGISFFPDDGDTPQELIKCADSAMYAVKEGSKNNYAFMGMDI